MSYQTVLVHIDQSVHAETRIHHAAALAHRHRAHLLGAAMLGVSREVFPAGFAERPGTLSASYLEPLAANAHAALARFTQLARAHEVSFEARFVCDQADDGLARLARFADLVVLSQDDPDEALPDMAVQLPDAVILHAGRPVLVVPRAAHGAHADAPDAVLVSWNGSREAAAALAGALPLLRAAPSVTVAALTGSDIGSADFAAQQSDLAAYLGRHGVRARFLERAAQDRDPGAQLLALAGELGCGLLVMGCYGHTRLHELCLGGASRTVLDRATVPVLCAHP
jgi:nucleotide-binding universal stress UspA family protein